MLTLLLSSTISAFRFQSYLPQFLSETASQHMAILSDGGQCVLLFVITFDCPLRVNPAKGIYYHKLYEIGAGLSRGKISFPVLSAQ